MPRCITEVPLPETSWHEQSEIGGKDGVAVSKSRKWGKLLRLKIIARPSWVALCSTAPVEHPRYGAG